MVIAKTSITVLAIFARMALSMQNVLHGCSILVSPPWTERDPGFSDQGIAISNFLSDDVNYD